MVITAEEARQLTKSFSNSEKNIMTNIFENVFQNLDRLEINGKSTIENLIASTCSKGLFQLRVVIYVYINSDFPLNFSTNVNNKFQCFTENNTRTLIFEELLMYCKENRLDFKDTFEKYSNEFKYILLEKLEQKYLGFKFKFETNNKNNLYQFTVIISW